MIIGDDSVMIMDAQATPRLANMVIEKIRTVMEERALEGDEPEDDVHSIAARN